MSINTEHFAVDKLKDALHYCGQVTPEFNTNDREHGFDGHIYVYSSSIKSDETYLGRIPVQIKGQKGTTTGNCISYQVEVEKLKRMYAQEKGLIYFVVRHYPSESETTHCVYYRFLNPTIINEILSGSSAQKKKSITLTLFPQKTDEITEKLIEIISAINGEESSFRFNEEDAKSEEENHKSSRTLDLYRAQSKAVRFIGRGEEIKLLEGFVKCNDGFLWWGISGPGGSGKTRLSLEFIENHLPPEQQWITHFLQNESDFDESRPDSVFQKIGDEAVACFVFVVIDYAEQHIRLLSKWLGEWSTNAEIKRLRVLLLGRSTDDGKYVPISWEESLKASRGGYKLSSFRYDKIHRLKSMDDGEVLELIDDFSKKIKESDENVRNLSEEQKETIIKKLHTQSVPNNESVRPLFAMLLTDIIMHGGSDEVSGTQAALDYIVCREEAKVRDWVTDHNNDNSYPVLSDSLLDFWHVATTIGPNGDPPLGKMKSLCHAYWDDITSGANQLHLCTPEEILWHTGLLSGQNVQAMRPDLLGEYAILRWLFMNSIPYSHSIQTYFTSIINEPQSIAFFFRRLFFDYITMIDTDAEIKEKILLPNINIEELSEGQIQALAIIWDKLHDCLYTTRKCMDIVDWLVEKLEKLCERLQNSKLKARIIENLGDRALFASAENAIDYYKSASVIVFDLTDISPSEKDNWLKLIDDKFSKALYQEGQPESANLYSRR